MRWGIKRILCLWEEPDFLVVFIIEMDIKSFLIYAPNHSSSYFLYFSLCNLVVLLRAVPLYHCTCTLQIRGTPRRGMILVGVVSPPLWTETAPHISAQTNVSQRRNIHRFISNRYVVGMSGKLLLLLQPHGNILMLKQLIQTNVKWLNLIFASNDHIRGLFPWWPVNVSGRIFSIFSYK